MKKVLFAICFGVFSTAAMAFEPVAYNKAEFMRLRDSGAKVLVDVHAKWCPTCKRQQRDLKEVSKSLAGVTFMKLDYDNKKHVNEFSKLINKPIPRQSTIVAYKDKNLSLYSVAETGDALKNKLRKALK